jgi:hypothetical protein
MKRLLILMVLAGMVSGMSAQPWKPRIEKITGNPVTKTITVKPGMKIIIKSLLLNTDTLKESRSYTGYFQGYSNDSLKIKLATVSTEKAFSNGIRETANIPAASWLAPASPDTNLIRVAVRNIGYLEAYNETGRGMAEIGEPIILGSLLVMIISPLISYNFKDGSFNSERYKHWALGGTIGVATGFVTVFTLNALFKPGRFQFETGWPDKNASVWRFR